MYQTHHDASNIHKQSRTIKTTVLKNLLWDVKLSIGSTHGENCHSVHMVRYTAMDTEIRTPIYSTYWELTHLSGEGTYCIEVMLAGAWPMLEITQTLWSTQPVRFWVLIVAWVTLNVGLFISTMQTNLQSLQDMKESQSVFRLISRWGIKRWECAFGINALPRNFGHSSLYSLNRLESIKDEPLTK